MTWIVREICLRTGASEDVGSFDDIRDADVCATVFAQQSGMFGVRYAVLPAA